MVKVDFGKLGSQTLQESVKEIEQEMIDEHTKQRKERKESRDNKKIKELEQKIEHLTKILEELQTSQLEDNNKLPGTMEMALHLKDYIFKNNIPSFNANDPKFRLGPIVYLIDIIKDQYKGKMI